MAEPSEKAPVALVVGAGDFIGAAIAKRFAAGGYTAAVGRRHADKLTALVAEIDASGGRARAFALDAREEENVRVVFETIERELGRPEVVPRRACAEGRGTPPPRGRPRREPPPCRGRRRLRMENRRRRGQARRPHG